MKDHVSSWLSAYHDGELSGRRLQSVETHLETCAECLAQLETLQELTLLLAGCPAAKDLLPQDIFTAQVGMRLPRTPEASFWKKAARTGWKALPFGILAAWVVLQAVYIVSGVVLLTFRVFPGADQYGFNLLGSNSFLGWSFLINLVLTFLMGLFYWSWMASWWIRLTNGNIVNN